MHILCAICSDLVNQAENIYVTKCGHIFHYQCLAQWIERSQTCPQCRNKVTNRCMFRMFPTISNEGSGEDVATLQSRLDDAQLQLRQNKTQVKEKDDKITAITADLKKNEDVIKSLEKKLVSRESAVSALKEQLEYVKLQTKETQKLREDNESLRKNIQTMHGLQKVLNATTEEVEEMLQGYNDVRTIATFATALKRALCESESKKKESRDKLHETKQQLTRQTNTVAELQAKVGQLESKLAAAKEKAKEYEKRLAEAETKKRKAVETLEEVYPKSAELQPDHNLNCSKLLRLSDFKMTPKGMDDAMIMSDLSFDSVVRKIEDSDSPYLNLKQSSLALTAIQRLQTQNALNSGIRPSDFALLSTPKTSKQSGTENIPANSQKHSIFRKKEPAKLDIPQYMDDMNISQFNISYDGLGGHSKLDTFPTPNKNFLNQRIPKITAKHRLKRPNPSGSQDIKKMLDSMNK